MAMSFFRSSQATLYQTDVARSLGVMGLPRCPMSGQGVNVYTIYCGGQLLSQRIATRFRRAVITACLASFAAMTPGCSFAVAKADRIGPNPDRDILNGISTRRDVERLLGTPIEPERLADGSLRAVYDYTTREGSYDLGWRFLDQRDILGFDLVSFFATELIFVPIAYFQKTKRTYRKE